MKTLFAAVLVAAVASPAFAQESDAEAEGYPANTTIKGYAKRDRLVLGGLDTTALSQLHEVEGVRAGASAGQVQSRIRSGGEEDTITTPSGTMNAYYGWEHLTAGVQASVLSAEAEAEEVTEEFDSRKVFPQLAYTFGSNITLGAGAEFNFLDVTESAERDNEFSYTLQRPIAGLAFHTPRAEFGVTYSGEVQDTDRLDTAAAREDSLSLAPAPVDDGAARAVYVPAETTVYGRGNVSEQVSLMSSVSLSRYDGNVDGAIELFDDFDARDRLAAKLMASYWTDARSRITLAGEYKGGATSAIGLDETGLGYRLVNTYGGAVEGVLSINRRTYLGLLAGYNRGERDDTSNAGDRYSAREETTRVVGSVAFKL